MIRINLLPIRAAKKKEEVKRQVTLFVTGLVLILGAGLFILQSKKSVLNEVETVNRKLEREIEDLKKVIKEARKLWMKHYGRPRAPPVQERRHKNIKRKNSATGEAA